MSEFNFFLNIDDCLNISNFEMFFYQLQAEHKFYVADAAFQADQGERSLNTALKGVKNYIGQSSFMIRDYRLIFGIRQPYRKIQSWKDTVLYRLLKIYYGLLDAQIYIKTKDQADKNVTVIMLYDVENTYDEREIPDEITDTTRDIPVLMEYLGVQWDNDSLADETAIAEAMLEACSNEQKRSARKTDEITRRFVRDYYNWMISNDLSEDDRTELPAGTLTDREVFSASQEMESKINNKVYNLNTFIRDWCIGQYCVFTKTVSSDTRDHRLALLSIVDYITTGLVTDENEKYTNENLKQKARSNWAAARNDREIGFKYGKMMQQYEIRMRERLLEMEKTAQNSVGTPPTEIEDPPSIIEDFDGGAYVDTIESCLQNYRMNGLSSSQYSASMWESTEQELKELTSRMERSLEDYSERLSSHYKHELDCRRMKKKQKAGDNEVYSAERIDEKLRVVWHKKTDLLKELEKQRMSPVVQYQDQLNISSAVLECGQKMRFYAARRKHNTLLNFLQLLMISGGIVLLHHFLLQESLIENAWNLLSFGICAGSAFSLCLMTFRLPDIYYRRQMKKELQKLEDELKSYMHSYEERAKNFEDYINTINALDVLNVYSEELTEMEKRTRKKNRMMLWHKERVEGHMNKCAFFRLIYEIAQEEEAGNRQTVELDLEKDVIHNRFYWPQSC